MTYINMTDCTTEIDMFQKWLTVIAGSRQSNLGKTAQKQIQTLVKLHKKTHVIAGCPGIPPLDTCFITKIGSVLRGFKVKPAMTNVCFV